MRIQLRAFQPKIRLYIEKEAYVIKTVESSWELKAALRLRHDVFYQELLNVPSPGGFDTDAYDLLCDHLVILDKKTGGLVGTYRLISSTYSNHFYSGSEFDIAGLLALPGNKLELGRACIQKEYRNGFIIALLWRGVFQYAQAVQAQYLFGCSSIQTTDLDAVAQICGWLRSNGLMMDIGIPPQPTHRLPQPAVFAARDGHGDSAALERARKNIPPLLLSYLKAGARVGSEPALDKTFRCIDFMTILETEKLAAAYDRKFTKC
jgi:putative hemolysin